MCGGPSLGHVGVDPGGPPVALPGDHLESFLVSCRWGVWDCLRGGPGLEGVRSLPKEWPGPCAVIEPFYRAHSQEPSGYSSQFC